MPLISFSKSHSKSSPNNIATPSLFSTSQRIPPASSSSFHVNPASTASLSQSHKGGGRSLGRTKDRFSKAFTFSLESFNVVGSIRGRSKPIPNINSNVSSHSISQSYTTYAGYEDEDYGEPDVEAEEIRPPSGLGRPATDLEFGHGIADEPSPMLSSFSRTPAKPRTSESSDDGDSLVEIRYPSGLGDIKLTITPVSITKAKLPARSTYPDFYLQNSQTNLSLHKCRRNSTKKMVVPALSPSTSRPVLKRCNFSTTLCKLLPILNSYLDTTTLSRLTLVDRGVGLEARKLLWCRVHMPLRLVVSESGRTALLDGQKAASFLDFLSKKDVSHFIRSLELICRLELEASSVQRPRDPVGTTIARHPHPRTRPPPLSLVLNNHNTPQMAFNITQASPAPTPSLITQRTNTSNASSTRSPFRRASLMIRNSSIPTAIRNSNLGRRLSILKTPPRELPPQERRCIPTRDAKEPEPTFSRTQSPSSHLTSLSISSSTWQPPPEWERVEREPPPSPLQASLKRTASPSSPRTPTPKSASNPPASWKNSPAITKSSLSSPLSALSNRTTRHTPSLPNLKPEQRHRRLSLSSLLPEARSTPSLNLRPSPAAHTPTSPYHNPNLAQTGSSSQLPPSSFRFEPPTPGTPSVPATPVTPQSAISLSAFPLPPPMTSPRPPMSATSSKLSPVLTVPTTSPHEQSSPQQPPRSATSTMSYSPFTPNLNRRIARDVDGLPVESSFENGGGIAYSISRPTELETRKITITAEQPGFIDGLKMGLKELANLEAVTIRYDIVTSVPCSSADHSNLCFNLLRTANQLFVTSLKDLHALKSIRIACPTDYLSLCSTQLSDLEGIFNDVKTSVVVCSISQH